MTEEVAQGWGAWHLADHYWGRTSKLLSVGGLEKEDAGM